MKKEVNRERKENDYLKSNPEPVHHWEISHGSDLLKAMGEMSGATHKQ